MYLCLAAASEPVTQTQSAELLREPSEKGTRNNFKASRSQLNRRTSGPTPKHCRNGSRNKGSMAVVIDLPARPRPPASSELEFNYRQRAMLSCDGAKISGSQAVGRNGYSSDTRPSSTAALIKAWGSVTPSEAIATIRWAILAFIAGVGREWSIRLTAMSSADLIVVSNSGLKLARVTIGIYSLPREQCGLAVDREAQVSITLLFLTAVCVFV